ncbi:hypothetical protein NDU88_005693 [Pleurodeles waltl]|uniref:Uncharacterized protein n=1 Tax=Pleurodeles waltl TaxID=8319 RepID=A0AAV7NVZ4_PLEWA|nr:hypothetical protein NDU88_005693 [Pleurodeles waltl]
MRAPSNQALLSARSLKLPVMLGAYNMRLHKGQLLQWCIRSAPPSPPAAVVVRPVCSLKAPRVDHWAFFPSLGS